MSLILSMLAAAGIPVGQSFSCTPTAVYDGDGPVWCAEGPRIRLAGIATREMDGTCRSNQPCPAASAEHSRDQLVQLVGVPSDGGARAMCLCVGRPCGVGLREMARAYGRLPGAYHLKAVICHAPWFAGDGR